MCGGLVKHAFVKLPNIPVRTSSPFGDVHDAVPCPACLQLQGGDS